MNVLLLGSGGRESAIAWKLVQSSLLSKLYIAPGNAGTRQYGHNLQLDLNDFEKIGFTCLELQIELIIVGPEEPLVKGLVDYLRKHESFKHLLVFGPSAAAAQLEGSKDFAKKFMMRHNIPTAAYATFTANQYDEAKAFLKSMTAPYVIKADGLAAGKGVLIIQDVEEAMSAVHDILLGGSFGQAGNKVVIEEFLSGIEFSVFAVFDGQNFLLLPEAKDYKRIGEGDTGPNTGGMGTLSPVPFYDTQLQQKVLEKIIEPTFNGLKSEAMDYKGVVFFGLILVAGEPFVIEYNCRLGDPETESILPRLEGDFLEICIATTQSRLGEMAQPHFSPLHSATVILVAEGYPGAYTKGKVIEIKPFEIENARVFHAGTAIIEGEIKTQGGRVLACNAQGNDLQEAIKKAYELVHFVHFEGCNYRSDIGYEFKS